MKGIKGNKNVYTILQFLQ